MDGKFIMIYLCGATGECASNGQSGICYGESLDGVTWTKPLVTKEDVKSTAHYPKNYTSPLCQDRPAHPKECKFPRLGGSLIADNCNTGKEQYNGIRQRCAATCHRLCQTNICRSEECASTFGKPVAGTNIVLSYGVAARYPMESVSVFVDVDGNSSDF
jgi:hypothetical protein